MSGIKYPPLNNKPLNDDGSWSKSWYRFFEALKNYTDKVADEVISGKWQIKQRANRVITDADLILTSSNFGEAITMDIGANDHLVTLPSVDGGDVGVSFTIIRIGDGRLSIKAADLDTIERSSPGGGIYCHESHRMIANATLYLASATQWGISGATGLWYLY